MVNAMATSIRSTHIDIIRIVALWLCGMEKESDKMVETVGQVRVAKDVRDLYISKQMMRDLSIIGKEFPSIQVASIQAASVFTTRTTTL